MKKSLFILISITLICILIIVGLIKMRENQIENAYKTNQEFESYTVNNIFGSSLMTLINKVSDTNEQNGVGKDKRGFFIENDKNSVIILVKFTESEDTYRMEQILRQGSEAFIKNYNVMSFKCTEKRYHYNTKLLSYLYFEQV